MDIYEKIKPLSYRQKQAVELWVTDGRKSKAKALRKAGYSEAICNQPYKVFSSLAVKRELELRGLGSGGMSNGLRPKGFDVSVKKQEPNIILDTSIITKEQIQDIQDKFDSLPLSPSMLKRMEREKIEEKNSFRPIKNDPNCNIFGEKLSNTDYEEKNMKMSDFSSL